MTIYLLQDNIEPSLPDLTYIGSDFLDFTPPFSPLKKISKTGESISGFHILDYEIDEIKLKMLRNIHF